MSDAQAPANEIWLYDSYGRFLHNDSEPDRLVAWPPEKLPDYQAGLLFDINPDRPDEVFRLRKRVSCPMPLPAIEPVLLHGAALALQITDGAGAYRDMRGCFIASHDDGSVTLTGHAADESASFVPLPMQSAKVLCPDNGLQLADRSGNRVSSPRPATGLRVALGERVYSLEVIGEVLRVLGTMRAGEKRDVTLPATADAPELIVLATRQ